VTDWQWVAERFSVDDRPLSMFIPFNLILVDRPLRNHRLWYVLIFVDFCIWGDVGLFDLCYSLRISLTGMYIVSKKSLTINLGPQKNYKKIPLIFSR
jgi:hypothetical protein